MRNAFMVALVAGALFASCSDGSSTHACGEPPAGLDIPILRTEEGAVVHWALEPGCVPASFDPALAVRSADLQAALDAWTSVGCSTLCFQAIKAETVAPGALDRRLHFALLEPAGPAPDGTSVSSIHIRKTDGVIVSARVSLAGVAVGRAEIVRLVGRTLGLEEAPAGVDSALSSSSDRLTPSESDVKTLCALYGKPALCKN